ncbi:MAG: class I SAM-dependent methyltransferase [Balneolaceae bacterium]
MKKDDMHWFEDWFDSPFYDLLYANRNEEEAARLAALIEEILPPAQFTDILDLGCGRGRHSLTLARRGYRVTGIDLSEEAIRQARKKAEGSGITGVEFHISDMRNPLDQSFDAVLNLFTSFGYFKEDSENIRVFESIYKMLRKDGILLLDYMNADWVRSTYEPSGEGEFRNVQYRITRYIEDDVIYKEIRFEGRELEEPLTYVEQVKLYDVEWFLQTFEHCGFSVEKLMGNYRGEVYNPTSSSRLVMVVRKKPSS